MQGKVKWFNDQKGYGFLERQDGEGDVFVHYSAIIGEGYRKLEEGQKVTFETETTDRGLAAKGVVLIGQEEEK